MFHVDADRCRLYARVVAKYGFSILLLASIGLNMWLGEELRATRRKSQIRVSPGTLVPSMSGVTNTGEAATIQLEAEMPTVFYYFSASCGWCERNWANVEALVRQTYGRYRVIGIAASEEVPAAVKDRGIPLRILTSVNKDTLAAYGFRGTPQTVVVGPDGRVLTSWTGAYQGDQAKSVAKFFRVRLPGLSPKRPLR